MLADERPSSLNHSLPDHRPVVINKLIHLSLWCKITKNCRRLQAYQATTPSCNMVLVITSIKSMKPSFPNIPYI